MGPDLPVADASNVSILTWKVVDGELHVRTVEGGLERVLRCVCGRSHWIVETRIQDGRGVLAVKCHGCGTAATLPLPELKVVRDWRHRIA